MIQALRDLWRSTCARAAGALLLAACSSGGGDGGTTTPQSIALSLSTPSATVTAGNSTTTTLSLARVGGFAGAVALTAEGAPSAVSVTIAPASLTGSTTTASVSIAVATNAPAGTSTILLRGTASGVSSIAAVYSLTIVAPPTPAITLVAGTGTLTAAQQATASVPITITRSGGFADVVTLAAEGLPTGVIATFAPLTLAAGVTSGTLSLAVGSDAPPGTKAIVIRASGTGVTAQTATIALTITQTISPDYTISATPASLPITAGLTASSVVTVNAVGGFAGPVQLTLEGAPTGVSGVFAPNPATAGTSTLTVSTTTATVPGTYNLTVRAKSSGIPDRTTTIAAVVSAAPAITLALGTPTLSAATGASATTAVTIARVGGFVGDVALTLDTPPTGVTGVFTPATIVAGNTTSSLALSIGATSVPGTFTLTVRGTGTGIAAQTATIALTIAATPNYTMIATVVSAAQGTTGTGTVTLTRSGNFAGAVALAVTGLPTGVTVAFNPTLLSGSSASLSVAVASNVATGTYAGTITGTAAGLANVTTPISLTVTQGTVAGAISWQFCDASQYPVWFAFRNGTNGVWTRVVAGGNNTYTFTMSGTIGGVAYAQPVAGSPPQVTIALATASELGALASNECFNNRTRKVLTGSFAGLSVGQTGTVNIGGSVASALFPTTTFRATAVDDGLTDLLAYRSTQTFVGNVLSVVPDRAAIRRSVNYAAGTVIPVIDMAGSESFPVQTAQITTTNAGPDAVTVATSLVTSNGTFAGFGVGTLSGGTSPYTVYGVPSSTTQAGDLHGVTATASNFVAAGVGTIRVVAQYNRDLANRSVTFGPAFNLPAFVTVGTLPYARVQGSGQWQPEYADRLFGRFVQQIGIRTLTWTISGTRGYFGSSSAYNFEIPDFSAVPGFDVNWGLQAGVLTQVSASGSGVSGYVSGYPQEGAAFRLSAVQGAYVP